jgi:hypothetical protein
MGIAEQGVISEFPLMAMTRSWSLKGLYGAQVLLIALMTAGFTLLATAVDFRSGWNMLWMLALPFALGFILNRDAARGAFMAMALTIVAFVVTTLTGGLLGD